MKKISGLRKPTEIFFTKTPGKHGVILEVRAVHPAAFGSADLVHQRKFEGAVTVGCRVEAGGVDIVAKADGKLLVIKAGAEDESVHEFTAFQFVGDTRPGTQLEGLVVAAAVAQQEFERVAGIHLEGGALEEGNHTRNQAETLGYHKFTACVEGELAVQRDILVAEGLVCPVQVAVSAAEVQVVVFIKNAEPQNACRHIKEQEVRVVNDFARLVRVVTTLTVVLARPAQSGAVDAALAHTDVGAENQVVRFAAVAAHFFSIGARHASLQRSEFGFAGLVAPQGTTQAKIIIAADSQLLIIGSRVGIVGILPQNGRPLVAVVRYNTVVTVHHAGHCRVQVERAHVELREVDILCLTCRNRQQYRKA